MNKNLGNGFNRIAPIYDAMTCLASFNQINKSQLAFLSQLSTQSTCLILGGGTGYFLQKLVEENKTIQITYVDASEKMIELAKKRMQSTIPDALERVTFVCKRVEDFVFDTYDVIVCNYFLDLFDESYIAILLQRFNQHLNKDALLYITDFSIPEKGLMHWTTKAGLKMLYVFFGWTTNLPTQKLSAIDKIVRGKGFYVLHTKSFLKGVLKCTVYKYL